MRKFALVFALALLVGLTAPSATPAHAQTRSARPVQTQTCSGHYTSFENYDWIANGAPTDTSCWSYDPDRAAIVTTTTCSPPWMPSSSKAWEFYYAGWISQSFTIPAGMTWQHFSMSYFLDFDDPNNDGAWDRFSVSVLDTTANTVLATDRYYGNMQDLYCASRELHWVGNLSGHTISVRIAGSDIYPDTHIRVQGIGLWQSP